MGQYSQQNTSSTGQYLLRMGNNGCTGQDQQSQLLVHTTVHTETLISLGSPQESGVACRDVLSPPSLGVLGQVPPKAKCILKGELECRKKKADSEIDIFMSQLQEKDNASTKILVQSRKRTVHTKQTLSAGVSALHCKKGVSASGLQQSQLHSRHGKQKVSKSGKHQQIPDEIYKANPLQPSSKLNQPLVPSFQKRPTLLDKSMGVALSPDNPEEVMELIRENYSCRDSDANNLSQLVLNLEQLQSSCNPLVQISAINYSGDLDPTPHLCTQHSSDSSSGQSQGSVILQVEIVIGNKSEKIMVKQGDTLQQLSARFIRQNGLPSELQGGLVHAIQQRMSVE